MNHRVLLALSVFAAAVIGTASCAHGTDLDLGIGGGEALGGAATQSDVNGAGGALVFTGASSSSSSAGPSNGSSHGFTSSSTASSGGFTSSSTTSGGGVCGNGVCEVTESCVTCPADCGTGCGACPHSWCNQGVPLNPGCNFCVMLICDLEPTCCLTTWDATCVAKAQQICVPACP
jgi:hypothetical protein